MFLKRIELSGFKSFADRTELEFTQGITAVVGPNGSGKSNISDGIRWVLGEQSAKSLRGGNMQDVIFSGSDSRKAVNYSEVSLTLDNSDYALPLDYSEVTVTRRIHRSGDSEYFINKQACRLKDITELFMDTGIGKEAYSIIGQGRIEEILSTRSEDRRAIFEEASGIVKYKTRRKEAQKKLDDTEQNLLRIHDLVSELEDQLEPLREQSETALQYKQLKEQLKQNEISVSVVQIEQLHSSWRQAGEQLKQLEHSQLELSTIVSKHDARLEKERLALRELEEELDRERERLMQISEEYDRCNAQGEVLVERRRNMTANREQLLQTMEQQKLRLSERREEREQLQAKTAEVAGQLKQLQAALKEEEDKLAGMDRSSEAEEELKAELIDTLNRLAQVRNELKFLEQQDEGIGRRVDKLVLEKQRFVEQLNELEQNKEQILARLSDRAAKIEAARNEYIRETEKMRANSEAAEQLQHAIRQWEQKLEAARSRRDTMRELQNDYDGFMHGVREVLRNGGPGGRLKGVRGAVAELLRVPARLETAIETALGPALQNIVMASEADAREAIGFLKRKQLGRATFLPMDVIRGRRIGEQELDQAGKQPGFVGVAVDLVQFDSEYEQIVRNLLGQIMIAEKLEDANRIAASCKYRFRVVTLDGDVVHAGGSMTGGSLQKRSANLLGRQRLIEAMDKEIAECQAQLTALRDKEAEMKREAAELASRLDALREEGEQLRIDEQQLKADMQQAETEIQHVRGQLALFEQDQAVHEDDRLKGEERKQQLLEEKVRLEEEEQRIQSAIKEAEAARKQNEAAREELQAGLTELKVRAAGLTQEKASLAQQLERLEQELHNYASEQQLNESMLAQLDHDLAESEQQLISVREKLNQLQLDKTACAESIEFKRAQRAQTNTVLDEAEAGIREERRKLQQVEEQLRQTEVRANRLDVELDGMLRKLSEEYEISYELAKERYPAPEDLLQAQSLIRELKREIAALGEVNLGAIEEYERVRERYEFLSAQKADLIEAKTSLYEVIREMNEEMSRRFRTTFDAIRAQFAIVFTRLFGGGRADLILADPDQLLETGIEIIAQPPGKKLQNLQLLSGGERALTAIALLFAILRIKPVPFCVLDEVEAALDDANVSRFAEYLREFSQDTQFIVVTHRKGTMAEADVLYGVTMENDGVSKLVSVRLEDVEDAVSA